MFDLQPTLRGKLLHLRPLREDDFEALYAAASDPKVWEQHPERLRYQRPVFENFFAGAILSKGALVALDSQTGSVLGSSRFTGLDLQNDRVEVGYTFLAPRCWGKGFNPEMKRLMLDHAFQYVGEVRFFIGENNRRSRTAIERIGARFLERIERQPAEGARYASVVYSIRKEDWR